MKAYDLSFSAHLISPEWCAARGTEGVGLLICNLWTGNQSPAGVAVALRYAREAGMLTAGYLVPHAYQTPAYHLSQAKDACGAEWAYLVFVAVDVEKVSDDPPTEQWTQAHLDESIALLELMGQRPIIYTARYFWNSTGLVRPDLPLWNAHYGLDGAPLPVDLGDPGYGGWASCVGHQYQNSHDVDGVTVDSNEFADVWLLGMPATTGPSVPSEAPVVLQPDVPEAEVERLHRERAELHGLVVRARRNE